MNTNQDILSLFKQANLPGAQTRYEAQENEAIYTKLAFNDRLFEILTGEIEFRTDKRKKMLIKQAKLRYPSVFIETLDYSLYPELKQKQMKQLIACDWLRDSRHLLITGKTGTGKTSLACILAQEAIKQLIPVLFFRLSNLLLELVSAQQDEKLKFFIRKLNRTPLLIIDDWGNALMNKSQRHLFFELIESRDLNASLLITSQYPVSVWHESFQDSSLADSVLDRIIHNAHHIDLKGDSLRKLMARKETKL
jgi:DNA replication protein DnaC